MSDVLNPLDSTRIAYDVTGEGPAVLWLHGSALSRVPWRGLGYLKALPGYTHVRLDLRGHGRSDKPHGAESYTPELLVADVLAVMDAEGIDAAAVVGHGMGAMLALELALRAPARVQRLVLCAGGPPLDDAARQRWPGVRQELLGQGLDMAALAQRLIAQEAGPRALPEGLQLARRSMERVHAATYRRALQALPTFMRDARDFARVLQPTLLIGGSADPCTPPEALQALVQVLPDARLALLPEVGRWPQLEDPEGFEATLLDFLANPARTLH